MFATVGDQIHLRSGAGQRVGEIVEVRGPEGEPPCLVRFSDGHEALVYPGPDCTLEPLAAEE
ncbi:DUF1918 domain-containing protein [Streptomyces solaniscabiei]|jgi:hypothetical protein|uniref:DUF1918 domain-containing protein n=1 Tax=Streptomyces solaniscabiei TaxID=2683255 RepID=UPI001CE2B365|nr:DUF1918 domain-containing protein [Streptomyces solaniscabiei]